MFSKCFFQNHVLCKFFICKIGIPTRKAKTTIFGRFIKEYLLTYIISRLLADSFRTCSRQVQTCINKAQPCLARGYFLLNLLVGIAYVSIPIVKVKLLTQWNLVTHYANGYIGNPAVHNLSYYLHNIISFCVH